MLLKNSKAQYFSHYLCHNFYCRLALETLAFLIVYLFFSSSNLAIAGKNNKTLAEVDKNILTQKNEGNLGNILSPRVDRANKDLQPSLTNISSLERKQQQIKNASDIIAISSNYLLFDDSQKQVLLASNANVAMPPSSMTKVMTALVVFEQIKAGKLKFDNQCFIGTDAWKKKGSSMFLNYGDVVTIEDLLKGLLAVSGNDAAIAIAESVGKGYANFIDMMNKQAEKIGLEDTRFANPHGLSEDGHYMSMQDLAKTLSYIYQNFPQYGHYLGLEDFTFRNIRQINRNPLIKENYPGVLGGKTGYTTAGGYGVVAAVEREGQRLIAVVNKATNPEHRSKLVTALFDYGFNYFNFVKIFPRNTKIVSVPIWLGVKDYVGAVTAEEIKLNLPFDTDISTLEAKAIYLTPIYAPVTTGQQIATLKIYSQKRLIASYPLIAKENIAKTSYIYRLFVVVKYRLKIFWHHFFEH
jgi:D-alanyl-D-alanine carboxypeptidase (penicillin-binding protein 5/6)